MPPVKDTRTPGLETLRHRDATNGSSAGASRHTPRTTVGSRTRPSDAPTQLAPGSDGTIEDDAIALTRAATALSLDLGKDSVSKLVAYLDLLDRWNHVYNLTAVQGRRERRVQHLHDSLSVVAALRRGVPSAAPRVLDVGSGAGLPGVVIALCWPEAMVECVDAVGKKAAFVAHVTAELELRNLVSTHARVESLPAGGRFDIVTARAFASLHDTVAATHGLLAPGGVWALAKGRRPDAEIAALPEMVTVFHVEQLVVPGLDATRHLVWLRASA